MTNNSKCYSSELAKRWCKMSFMEQMANIGSEVDRAFHWKSKNQPVFSQKSIERALELIDLTLQSLKEFPRLREVARTREALVDYFFCANEYAFTETQWRKYFLQFAMALRKDH